MEWKKPPKKSSSLALPIFLTFGLMLIVVGLTLYFAGPYVRLLRFGHTRNHAFSPATTPRLPSPSAGITPLKLAPIPEAYATPGALQVDGWVMREEYKKKVAQKFAAEDFAWLEKEAERLGHGERWPGGTWVLSEFHEGIVQSEPARDPKKFQAVIDRWKIQFPASQTPVVALGGWWTKQAWQARGSRWASLVPENAWQPFKDCLARARETLETIPRKDVRSPEWFSAMMVVCLGQQWDRAEADQLFVDATTLAPSYVEFYNMRANYLLPRWNGEPGEWESFARQVSADQHNPSLYARIVWSVNHSGEDLSPVDWRLFAKSGDDLIRQWPNSGWNIAHLCGVAVADPDFSVFNRWARLLHGVAIPNASVTPGLIRYTAMLAEHPDYHPPTALATIPTDDVSCYAVAFLPSGQVAYGTSDGMVKLVDPASPKEAKTLMNFHGKSVSKMAVSPDGKLLAVGQGVLTQKTPGFVAVYDLEQKKEIARIGGWKGTAEFPAFSPDGKFLYAAGGLNHEKAELKRWNRETGAVEDLDWVKEAREPLCNIVISPDGKTAAADWFQNIRVWDTSSGRLLHDGPPIQGTADCVWCVRFSPDGKTIVAANSPSYIDRGESTGGLLWWDAQTLQQLPPHPDDQVSGADRMIISPDGNRIYNNDQDGLLFVRDAHTGKLLNLFPSGQEYALDIAISPDGKRLATAGRNGTVKIWNTAVLDASPH